MPEPDRPATSILELFEQWNKPLKRWFARRLPRAMDAEDLAQETYLRLLRVKDLDAIEQPQAYLYYVARNIAAEWRARSQHDQQLGQQELDALIELTTPEMVVANVTEERRFDEALRRLPASARAAIYLKLRDGKTHEEIARYLATSPRMVRKHLTVGYAALRRHLLRD